MHFPSRLRGILILSGFLGSATVAFAADVTTTNPPASGTAKTPAATANSPALSDALSANTPSPVSEAKAPQIENTVVKVFATVRRPDLGRPWAKSAPTDVTGSGVIIEGKRILTNAHVVGYASQVQVQANQSGEKISAEVEAIAHGIDLAILKLEDESFFETRPPLERATALPDIKEPVMAYGYPTGGTSLSITKGIVSRIEFAGYGHSTAGLRIQIDAAINSGNSGGPAIAGDKMIGLAFSHLGGAQNIGYIIPNEEVDIFLADVADGNYDGKPAMHDELQTLENPALRAYLGLKKDVQGIIVHEPYGDDASYPLKPWDVITHIGDTPIDEQGMIKLGTNLRVRFQYLVQQIARDGKVPLTVIRQGNTIPIELPVPKDRPFLVSSLRGAYPSYFVFGPLVFSTATAELIDGISSNAAILRMFAAIGNPLVVRSGDRPQFPGESLVVVSSPFFPHKLSKGYSNPIGRVVESVNGTRIKNLVHLVETLREVKDEFVVIEFGGRNDEVLVLPRKDCVAATEEILSDNGVRAQGSPETLKVWEGK